LIENQDALLGWFDQQQRGLPWRDTRDPWLVLVSEVMLQQTQVSRVVPRFRQFVARFPTPRWCAAAPCSEVITLWSGLGYNRRARMLHAAAVAIVERHDGEVPDTLDELSALPGVGAYTARAVLAFAYERDIGVVDTNAARVLARAFSGRRLQRLEVQALADEVVPIGEGWRWNQAMLDFGATVCTKRAPRCDGCPLAVSCAWSSSGEKVDPALGTAGVSTGQSPFEGSDRQGRGRLVAKLRDIRVLSRSDAARVAGWPDDPERAERVLQSLVADGLVTVENGSVARPVASNVR
jgi:A/G-specific adenine glycosylase